jgi:hypothetical protein
MSQSLCPCQWEGSACTHERYSFFLFGGQSVGIIYLFIYFWVLMCSNHVPNRFSKGSPAVPNTFPIAPQIYVIWFAQSSTFIVYKLKRWTCLWGSVLVPILLLGSKDVLLFGNAQCSKKFEYRSINMAPSTQEKKSKKEKKSCEHTHE